MPAWISRRSSRSLADPSWRRERWKVRFRATRERGTSYRPGALNRSRCGSATREDPSGGCLNTLFDRWILTSGGGYR